MEERTAQAGGENAIDVLLRHYAAVGQDAFSFSTSRWWEKWKKLTWRWRRRRNQALFHFHRSFRHYRRYSLVEKEAQALSGRQEARQAKMPLLHKVRTNLAAKDEVYGCVIVKRRMASSAQAEPPSLLYVPWHTSSPQSGPKSFAALFCWSRYHTFTLPQSASPPPPPPPPPRFLHFRHYPLVEKEALPLSGRQKRKETRRAKMRLLQTVQTNQPTGDKAYGCPSEEEDDGIFGTGPRPSPPPRRLKSHGKQPGRSQAQVLLVHYIVLHRLACSRRYNQALLHLHPHFLFCHHNLLLKKKRCIFRAGGNAVHLSKKRQEARQTKMRLLHRARSSLVAVDEAYGCVIVKKGTTASSAQASAVLSSSSPQKP